MKRYSTCTDAFSKPVHIPGTSQTIPGLAPDLQTLLAAATEGEPLPLIGKPLFDDSEEAGLVRMRVGNLPPEEILLSQEKPAPEEEPEAPAPEEVPEEVPDEGAKD